METKEVGDTCQIESEELPKQEEVASIQLSPTAANTSSSHESGKQRSPLVYLKKRITGRSSSKKRRDSGHSEGDCSESSSQPEEDARSTGKDQSTISNTSLDSTNQLSIKEKPRRGIAKVFYDLRNRSKVRKSNSAPSTAVMSDGNSTSPIVIVDDDSFSSYATPMEAHSSGYSTPMFDSNAATPEISMNDSLAEIDEGETTVETPSNNSSPAPVPAASAVASSETRRPLVETRPVEETPHKKPDCRPTPDEKTVEKETSTPATAEASTGAIKSRWLTQHRSSIPYSAKELQDRTAGATHPAAGASAGEIRFCFSEYKPDDPNLSGSSPGRDFIRSLPADPSGKMDSASAGDINGYPKNEHLYKVLVIGELGTGKTSIIKRYVHQFFSQHYRATIGVDFALKVVHWDQSTIIRLQLWDIAGQERFGNMTRVYYKEAVGAFIVFDVTRSSTFDSVAKWKQDLDTKVQLPDGSPIPCVLLANKCDQPKEGIAASPIKMDEYCKEKGFAGWFETSAKDNINIDDAAKFLVGTILQNDQWNTSVRSEDPDKLDLNGKGGADANADKKGGCC